MGFLLLSGCVDGNDSLSVLARDVCGRNDAAIPAATSLSPSRRLMWPSELPAGAVATSISFIQVFPVRAPVITRPKTSRSLDFPKIRRGKSESPRSLQVLGAFEPELGGDSQPYRGTPLGREGLPIEIKCQDRLWVQCAGHVDAGRIPIEASEAHKGCAKVCSDPLKKCSQRHPAPAPDLAPALDADVASDLLDLRQPAQRRDCPGSLF